LVVQEAVSVALLVNPYVVVMPPVVAFRRPFSFPIHRSKKMQLPLPPPVLVVADAVSVAVVVNPNIVSLPERRDEYLPHPAWYKHRPAVVPAPQPAVQPKIPKRRDPKRAKRSRMRFARP